VSENQVLGLFFLIGGLGSGAHLVTGWRKGEMWARGASKRSDGPMNWWSAVILSVIFSGACVFIGVLSLFR
jgi:hypothetical protein